MFDGSGKGLKALAIIMVIIGGVGGVASIATMTGPSGIMIGASIAVVSIVGSAVLYALGSLLDYTKTIKELLIVQMDELWNQKVEEQERKFLKMSCSKEETEKNTVDKES